MKRRMIRIGLLGVFLGVLLTVSTGPLYQTVPADVIESERLAGDKEQQAKPITEKVQTENITETVRGILASADRDFFCGYPVSESFLCWIAGRYGHAILFEIAGHLTGEYDAGLWYDLTGNTMHVLWTDYCKEHGFASYLWKNVVWKDAADPSCIKLDFIGDICLDDEWCTMQAVSDGLESCLSSAVKEELQGADLTVANNEFTFTDSDEALEGKAYTFRSAPSNVKLLSLFGVDLVSLANNHAYDFGEQGLLDTMNTLSAAGIPYTGAGQDIKEASAVRYFIVGGRKFAIVSATEIERFSSHTKRAKKGEPGVLKTEPERYILSAISEAKANSDYVIVYLHWGAEGKNYYDEGQQTLAETYVEAGVDAVIGGHPHRLQGVTYLSDVPVVYSLGNFWFSSGTLYTTIAQIRIDGDGGLSLYMLPCIQDGFVTSMLVGQSAKEAFYHYLADVSMNVGIDANGRVHPFPDVSGPGQSPYMYTSGRKYGLHMDNVDLEGRDIDIVGNLQ